MKIEYQIYNPGGNITALITAPKNLGAKECLHLS